MKTELQATQNNQIRIYSESEKNLIKNTVAKNATDDELRLFLYQAERTGLDPLTRQIIFMKDKSGRVTFITSVDGFRLIAQRSGKYEGQTKVEWSNEKGEWFDIWKENKPPYAARVGVYKNGFREALYAVAKYSEYKPTVNPFMWDKMPALMVAKVAECLALRKAFPNDLSGIYGEDEMAQAIKTVEATVEETKAPIRVVADQPGPNDGTYLKNCFTWGMLPNREWGTKDAPWDKCDQQVESFESPNGWWNTKGKNKPRHPRMYEEIEAYKAYKESAIQMGLIDEHGNELTPETEENFPNEGDRAL